MERQLGKIEKKAPALFEELQKQMRQITADPSLGKRLKGDLKEFMSYDFKFQRVSLRICYAYQEDEHVTFIYAGTRENFYDQVKNYVNN